MIDGEIEQVREALARFAAERVERLPYRLTGAWTARVALEGEPGDDGEVFDFTSEVVL